ncbi:MAG TPA: hypothetical protein VF713_08515 [Thermoanaerobaculia bacterium]
MRKGLRNVLICLGSLSLLVVVPLVLTRCGSIVSGELTANGKAFNFREPPCQAAAITTPPAGDVDIRYLGSGGIYVGWKGSAILIGPFFSNPSVFAAQFSKLRYDTDRIRQHLKDIDGGSVRAILAGHSHYDHLGDVPIVARQFAPAATIYANITGVRMLAAYPDLKGRTRTVDEKQLIHITDGSGVETMRIHPVKSDHAPQLCSWRRWPCDFATAPVDNNWTKPFEEHKLREFSGGQTYAFVIDLLDEGQIRYRIYYNDAAAEAPLGLPTPELSAAHPYDLAVICIASYDFVRNYPTMLLGAIKPRHIILSHYENFFSKSEGRWEFVPLLTDAKADAFIRELREQTVASPLPPVNTVCGPSTREWTMPVPAAQLLFRPDGQ